MKGVKGTKYPPHIKRLNGVWAAMRQRCNNPNQKSYAYYGGRGIRVDKRWDDFNTFLKDMSPTYKQGLQLDRIDNNGNYSSDNCRWSTRTEQTRNQRSNVLITFEGKTLPLSEWAEVFGVPRARLNNRLRKGWPIERILSSKLWHRCGNSVREITSYPTMYGNKSKH
jgi:hypothetical protein